MSQLKKRPAVSLDDDDDIFLQDNMTQIDALENRMSICDKIKPLFTPENRNKVSCYLMCNLCNNILCYPCYMSCCGQRFCKPCIGKFWETANKICPTPGCGKHIKTKLADIRIDRDIHNVCLSLYPDRVGPRVTDIYETLTDSEKKICIMRTVTRNIESNISNPVSMRDYINKLDYYLNLANLDNISRCGCKLVKIPTISIKLGNWYLGCPMFLVDKKVSCSQYNNIQEVHIFFKDEDSLKTYTNKITNRIEMIPNNPLKKQKTNTPVPKFSQSK